MATPFVYDEHDTPRLTRGVQWLLAMNVAMLFLQYTVVSDADAFAVLGFQNGSLQRTLWSAVTYMFVHYGIWHLALNMYALVAFGPRLEELMGTRAFTLYYLWCGIGGVVAYLLFPHAGLLVGSSGAVFGVLFGYVHQWPRDEMALFRIVPMRALTLTVLLIAASLALGVVGGGDVAAGGEEFTYLAHLGGIAFGWLYFNTPQKASIDRIRQRILPAPDYSDETPPRAIPRTQPRARVQHDEVDEIVTKSNAVASQQRPSARAMLTPVRTTKEARVAEVDRVLDKISLTGLASLTGEERAVLDEMARRLKGGE